MSDRALLEAAARAVGKHHQMWAEPGELLADKGGWVQFIGHGHASIWNPLTDDGDALRLAVKLDMTVDVDLEDGCTRILNKFDACLLRHMHHDGGPEAATRRAITRAAAAMGGNRE